MKRLALFALLAHLAGCSVVDEPYPIAWDPVSFGTAYDCRAFRGVYADNGESSTGPRKASLTREIFGEASPWENAISVELDPQDEILGARVSVKDGEPFRRVLKRTAGEYACERSKLVVRGDRWVYSGLMSGREHVTIEMYLAGPYLVARVDEVTTGVMFMVVPLSGESTRWFRFRRIQS